MRLPKFRFEPNIGVTVAVSYAKLMKNDEYVTKLMLKVTIVKIIWNLKYSNV